MQIIIILAVLLFSIPNPVQSSTATSTVPIEIQATTTSVVQIDTSNISTTTLEIDPILGKIAICESSNDPNAKNPNGTASGRFQFIHSSWVYYGHKLWGDNFVNKNIFDWNDNTELANYVFLLNGTSDWIASESCWG